MGLKDWRARARLLKELAARELRERLEEGPLVAEATERLRRWLGEPSDSLGSAPSEVSERAGSPEPFRGGTPAEADAASLAGERSAPAPEGAGGAMEDGPGPRPEPESESELRDEPPPLASAALARLLAEQGKLQVAEQVAEQVLAQGTDEALAEELRGWRHLLAAMDGERCDGCFPVVTRPGTLSVGWCVSARRLARTGKLLPQAPQLTVRLVLWGLDEAGWPRRRLLERTAAGPVGYTRFEGLGSELHAVVAVGLRHDERFVSAVHAGPLTLGRTSDR